MHAINIQLVSEVISFVMLGLVSGLLSGLLGAGGGLVIVPGLLLIFRFLPITPTLYMHIAIGTSLATMLVVSLRSLFAHLKHNVSFFHIYKQLALGVIFGVILGGVLAHFIHSHFLRIAFGAFVFYMSYRLLFHKEKAITKTLPGPLGMSAAGTFTGLLAGLLGIGGSAFSVPFLTGRGTKMHVAVTVSIVIAMTVSVFGTVTFAVTGLHAVGLPAWSTGYIYWPAWLGIVIGGVFAAPFGAKLSHKISEKKLKQFFAIFLIIVGVHMWVPF